MHNSLVLDEAGKPVAMTGTARDISDLVAARTELREAKERAEAANTAKSRFLATISHELRTPLNAVIGFSELLQDEVLGPLTGRQARAVRHTLQGGRHLLRLVNDVLDLSGIEAGRVTVRRTPINLTSILSECVDFFLEAGRKRGIDIEFLPADDLDDTAWSGDEVRIKQILFNVLSNALKFTPDGGRIRMTARPEGDRAVISVADTGRGIRPEDMSRIFEVFEQADASYAREESGMGIGLAVTRRLVELHNGRIRVESEGVDKGSTFHIELPLAPSSEDAP
jgi:signal transduction histidine kinase